MKERDSKCAGLGLLLIGIAVLGFIGLVLFGCGGHEKEEPSGVTGWGVGDTMVDEAVMGYLPAGGRCATDVPSGALTRYTVSEGKVCASTGWWVIFDGSDTAATTDAIAVKSLPGVEVVRVRFRGASGGPETPDGLAAWVKSAKPVGPVALDPSLKFGGYFPQSGPILHLIVDLESLRILGEFSSVADVEQLLGRSTK